jgi:hypothetical protein
MGVWFLQRNFISHVESLFAPPTPPRLVLASRWVYQLRWSLWIAGLLVNAFPSRHLEVDLFRITPRCSVPSPEKVDASATWFDSPVECALENGSGGLPSRKFR